MDDSDEIRSLVQKYIFHWERRDVRGFMALWSEHSPRYRVRVWRMRRLFGNEGFRFSPPTVSDLKVQSATGQVSGTCRVASNLIATHRHLRQERATRIDWSLRFVKEQETWKVWHCVSTEDDSARTVSAAESASARDAALQGKAVTPELVFALISLADGLLLEGNNPRASTLYEYAMTLADRIGCKSGAAHAVWGLSAVKIQQCDYEEGLRLAERALTLSEEAHDRVARAWTLQNIGNAHIETGQFERALEFYLRVLGEKEALEDQTDLGSTLNNIGEVYRLQGKYERALEYYQKDREISRSMRDRLGEAISHLNMGTVHRARGDQNSALEWLKKAVAQLQAENAEWVLPEPLNNLGLIHLSRGEIPAALEHFHRALKTAEAHQDRKWAGISSNHIGLAHLSQDNLEEAERFIERALATAQRIGDVETSYRAWWNMGNAHRARKDAKGAIAAYQKSVESLERMTARVTGGEEARLSFLQAEGRDGVYAALVGELAQEGRVAEALLVLERARSKQLLDSIRLGALTVRDDNLRALLTRAEELEQTLAAQERTQLEELSRPDDQQEQTRVANLTRRIAVTRAELLRVANAIHDANPDYERFLTIKPTDLRSVQRRLPPGVVVVEYLPLETALTIIVVDRENMIARAVAVSRQRIEQLLESFQQEMRRASRRTVRTWNWNSDEASPLRETLVSLYAYLISPIQQELLQADTMIVVPSGALYYLPFHALARESSDRSLSFLVQQKRLAILTSLDLWEQINQQVESRSVNEPLDRLAAFGNPDGTLPESEKEVNRIGQIFEGSLVFTGSQVTRKRIESLPADTDVVHFATHGRLNNQDVNECYLTLAKQEAPLKLGEIYGLAGRYPAKLTVLSACETAVGRKDPGNEVAHLANAFVEAGSTSILASLWGVSDESTARLMEAFYKQLKSGKTIAEAKRLAEISLLQDPQTAHPYYWAPFILIGDWR